MAALESVPLADQYAAAWVLVHTGPHRDHGGWRPEPGGAVCACGAVLTAEGKAAA